MQFNNEPIRYASVYVVPFSVQQQYMYDNQSFINQIFNNSSFQTSDDYAIDYLLTQIPSSNIIERLFSDYISNKNKLNETEYNNNVEKNDTIIECPICFNNKESIKINKCGHEYCEDCIKKWLQEHSNTCPICRIDISDEKNEEEGEGEGEEEEKEEEEHEEGLELQENV